VPSRPVRNPRYVVEVAPGGWEIVDLGPDRRGHWVVGTTDDHEVARRWADYAAADADRTPDGFSGDDTAVDPAGSTDGYHGDRAAPDVLDEDSDDDSANLTVEISLAIRMVEFDQLGLCWRVNDDKTPYENPYELDSDDSYGDPGILVNIQDRFDGALQIFTDWKGRVSVRFFDGAELGRSFRRQRLFDAQPLFDEHDKITWVRQNFLAGAGDLVPFQVLVALLGSGGAGAVLAAVLGKFLLRHKHKKVEFYVNGELKSAHGYTASEFGTILRAVRLSGETTEIVRGQLRDNPVDAEMDRDAFEEALMNAFEAVVDNYDHLLLEDDAHPDDADPEDDPPAP
jgi:hypothetical protein